MGIHVVGKSQEDRFWHLGDGLRQLEGGVICGISRLKFFDEILEPTLGQQREHNGTNGIVSQPLIQPGLGQVALFAFTGPVCWEAEVGMGNGGRSPQIAHKGADRGRSLAPGLRAIADKEAHGDTSLAAPMFTLVGRLASPATTTATIISTNPVHAIGSARFFDALVLAADKARVAKAATPLTVVSTAGLVGAIGHTRGDDTTIFLPTSPTMVALTTCATAAIVAALFAVASGNAGRWLAPSLVIAGPLLLAFATQSSALVVTTLSALALRQAPSHLWSDDNLWDNGWLLATGKTTGNSEQQFDLCQGQMTQLSLLW